MRQLAKQERSKQRKRKSKDYGDFRQEESSLHCKSEIGVKEMEMLMKNRKLYQMLAVTAGVLLLSGCGASSAQETGITSSDPQEPTTISEETKAPDSTESTENTKSTESKASESNLRLRQQQKQNLSCSNLKYSRSRRISRFHESIIMMRMAN